MALNERFGFWIIMNVQYCCMMTKHLEESFLYSIGWYGAEDHDEVDTYDALSKGKREVDTFDRSDLLGYAPCTIFRFLRNDI